MSSETTKTLTTYQQVFGLIAEKMGVEASDCECEYYPFYQGGVSKGFFELIFPVADSSGRLLRGAGGNGPIFIFLYYRGSWTYLGEMHGAQVVAGTSNETTEFTVYSHHSATSGVERLYQLQGSKYVCVSETDILEK